MFEDPVQPNAEPVAWRYLVRGIWSVTNIKGAAEFWQSEGCVVEPLYTALAQSNAEPKPDDNFERHQNTRISKLEREIAELTAEQSNAEPVAWRYAYPDYPGHWNVTSDKLTADERLGNAGCIIEPLYTAPPRPNASTGLIKAADEAAWLIEFKPAISSVPTFYLTGDDPDEFMTTDANEALRFARKIDAEAVIKQHGWTEAFASEHMWPTPIRAALPTGAGNDPPASA